MKQGREDWKSRWESQLTELKRMSRKNDSRGSWGARMRRQRSDSDSFVGWHLNRAFCFYVLFNVTDKILVVYSVLEEEKTVDFALFLTELLLVRVYTLVLLLFLFSYFIYLQVMIFWWNDLDNLVLVNCHYQNLAWTWETYSRRLAHLNFDD